MKVRGTEEMESLTEKTVVVKNVFLNATKEVTAFFLSITPPSPNPQHMQLLLPCEETPLPQPRAPAPVSVEPQNIFRPEGG